MKDIIPFGMIGASGRMGQSIIELSKSFKTATGQSFLLTGAIDQTQKPAYIFTDDKKIPVSDDLESGLQNADVAIDFSSPEFSLKVCQYCSIKNIPLVVGTTGFNSEQKDKMLQYSKKIPLIISPNMSIGVNLLFELTNLAARVLQTGYDIEVVETHHHYKKDAPSGTAMKIKEILIEALGRNESDIIYGRKGITGERNSSEIGMHTLRGGDVVGDHTVHFFGDGERVELTHKASSRSTFATGALRAASYLIGKNAGLYTLRDVLGLDQLNIKNKA